MKLLDCNDASLRLWHEGEAIWSPGIAWLSDGRYHSGKPHGPSPVGHHARLTTDSGTGSLLSH